MTLRTVAAKKFMNRSSLNEGFTCNPYVGCQHGCVYCYARYMMSQSGQVISWGKDVLVKKFPDYAIPRNTGSASLILSTVTDCYQPLELEVLATRKVLEAIQESELKVSVITKSDLVVRDLDLFRQMKSVTVGFSIALDDQLSELIEPGASKPSARIEALKTLKENGISTYVFVAPIIPYLTDVYQIIAKTRDYADYYMFDTLNLKHPQNLRNFLAFIRARFPHLYNEYARIYLHHDRTYYQQLKLDLKAYLDAKKIPYQYIYDLER